MEGKEPCHHLHRHQHHPLLTRASRKEGYSHGFSPSQIQALAAACEAFLPSLSPDTTTNGDSRSPPQLRDQEEDENALRRFYKTPGSQPPFPDEVQLYASTY